MKKVLYSLLFISLLMTTSGCGEEVHSVTNVQLSTEVDKDELIINPDTTFNDNTKIIYGQASFHNPVQNVETYLQIIWNRLDEGEKVPVTSTTISTKQSGTVIFRGNRPGQNWPIGEYAIDFIVNDEIIGQYLFTIRPTTEDPIKGAYLTDETTTQSVNSAHEATSPTNTFRPQDDPIYLSLSTTDNTPANATIKVEWFYLTKSRLINSESQTVKQNTRSHFTLEKRYNTEFLDVSGNWPSGDYKADLYVNNDFIRSIQFSVS